MVGRRRKLRLILGRIRFGGSPLADTAPAIIAIEKTDEQGLQLRIVEPGVDTKRFIAPAALQIESALIFAGVSEQEVSACFEQQGPAVVARDFGQRSSNILLTGSLGNHFVAQVESHRTPR